MNNKYSIPILEHIKSYLQFFINIDIQLTHIDLSQSITMWAYTISIKDPYDKDNGKIIYNSLDDNKEFNTYLSVLKDCINYVINNCMSN